MAIPADLAKWRSYRLNAGYDLPMARSPWERDRDRVLYSPAFRRLQAVTQVMLAADYGHLQHNRLTHSLKVAQVGRRIAERLDRTVKDTRRRTAIGQRGGLNADVVEAAGLAHDLGHPPFGHIAEDELQKLVEADGDEDSFEGNAQSFRIVTKLAATKPDYEGLDLTRATLNAIAKYPWTRKVGSRKWGCYSTEGAALGDAREGVFTGDERSLEADIMDWADDITYAIHDVEDFYRAGLIPMSRLRGEQLRRSEIQDRVQDKLKTEKDPRFRLTVSKAMMKRAWGDTIGAFSPREYNESPTVTAMLNSYSSGLIDSFVRATTLSTAARLKIDRDVLVQVALLKELTKVFVVEAPSLATQQIGQRRVVRDLYGAYIGLLGEASTAGGVDDPTRLAVLFPTRMSESVAAFASGGSAALNPARIAADTIAGMTEVQAQRLHQRLLGIDFGQLIDPAIS